MQLSQRYLSLQQRLERVWQELAELRQSNSVGQEYFELLDEQSRLELDLRNLPLSAFEPEPEEKQNNQQPTNKWQPTQKTLEQLRTEILTAATSSQSNLALTQVAAQNRMPFELVKAFASTFLQQEGMGGRYDLEHSEYCQCIEEIRHLELKCSDPGEKAWKLQSLARKYGRSERQLQESYCKSLLAQHVANPIGLRELKEQYGDQREWLLKGWIPRGSLILLHAQGGLGKTLFAHHLIKCLSMGIDWGEYKVQKPSQGILYIQTDTAPFNLIEALDQAGIAEDLPIFYQTNWRIDHTAYLYNWVKRYRPALVLVDSLTSVSRHSTISENDVQYARPILYLTDIAKEFNCSFLLIHHSNAEGGSRGTTAVRNAVDEVWRIDPVNPKDPSNPERILVQEKSRSRMPMCYRLKFDDDDYSWECAPGQDDEAAQHNDGARWLITNHLEQNQGVRYQATDLAETLNIPEATVRRELPGLFREGLIDRQLNPMYKNGSKTPRHFYLTHASRSDQA